MVDTSQSEPYGLTDIGGGGFSPLDKSPRTVLGAGGIIYSIELKNANNPPQIIIGKMMNMNTSIAMSTLSIYHLPILRHVTHVIACICNGAIPAM